VQEIARSHTKTTPPIIGSCYRCHAPSKARGLYSRPGVYCLETLENPRLQNETSVYSGETSIREYTVHVKASRGPPPTFMTSMYMHWLECPMARERNKHQSVTLCALSRNIATSTPQYYALGNTTLSDSDPVILRGLKHRGVWKSRNIMRSA
jgi:hypothetical protein